MILWLLNNPADWVNRRVEAFELVDDRTVRRRMSVDLALPAEAEGHDVAATLTVIPLTVLVKRKLRAFDIRGEEGQALSVLSTPENGEITTRLLASFAAEQLDEELVPDTRTALHDAATKRLPDALSAFEVDEKPDQLQRLSDDAEFMALLNQLARVFILMTPRQANDPTRRVLKFAYEDRHRERDGERWLRTRLGWAWTQYNFPIPSASRTASYHAEIEAPADAEIIAAAAVAGPGGEAVDIELGARSRTHLHVSDADSEFKTPVVSVSLRAQRSGFLRQAALTCFLVAGLLALGRLRLDQLAGQVEAAAALLLVVPAVVAAYLVRPGEHPVVATAFVGVRMMVVIAGACAIGAGFVLVADLAASAREFVWIWLTLLAAACFVGVAISNVLPRAPAPYSRR